MSERNDVGRPHRPLTATQRAAEVLPGASSTVRSTAPSDRFGIGIAMLTCAAMPVWIFVKMWDLSWGWAIVLAGLPTWLVVRALFFMRTGSETGIVTVDGDGVIHLRTGRFSVRRLQRIFDTGAGRWFGSVWVLGILVGAGGPIGLGVLCVLLDSALPAAVFLSGTGFALLDLLRFIIVIWRIQRPGTGQRTLDGSVMLPALALYARHHGWRQTVRGVPADLLAETMAAHPDEAAIVDAYASHAAAMRRLGQMGAGPS